jgi:hypothetical protein
MIDVHKNRKYSDFLLSLHGYVFFIDKHTDTDFTSYLRVTWLKWQNQSASLYWEARSCKVNTSGYIRFKFILFFSVALRTCTE